MFDIAKIAILIDPNKGEAATRVHKAVISIIRERKGEESLPIEIWVGDTDEIYKGVHKTLEKLDNDNIPKKIPKVIFPGHPLQISTRADYIMFPTLLNTYSLIMKLALSFGKRYHWLFKNFARLRGKSFPVDRKYGYIVLRSESSVGQKLKAKNLTDEKALEEIKSKWRKKWMAIYLEAGSGNFAYTIANRTDLVKDVKAVAVQKGAIVITGGGVSTPEEVKRLIKAGSDLIVISTSIEQSNDPKTLIESFIEALKNTYPSN